MHITFFIYLFLNHEIKSPCGLDHFHAGTTDKTIQDKTTRRHVLFKRTYSECGTHQNVSSRKHPAVFMIDGNHTKHRGNKCTALVEYLSACYTLISVIGQTSIY